jgi:hypothetical protein
MFVTALRHVCYRFEKALPEELPGRIGRTSPNLPPCGVRPVPTDVNAAVNRVHNAIEAKARQPVGHPEQHHARSSAWFAARGAPPGRCRCSPTVCAERRLPQTIEPIPCSSRRSPRAVRQEDAVEKRPVLLSGRFFARSCTLACPLSIVCQKNGRGLKC